MSVCSLHLRGTYRAQSRDAPAASELAGAWRAFAPGALDSERVNGALARAPAWLGVHRVQLRAAIVWLRSGAFTQPDALYYRRFFRPDAGSDELATDVLDLTKLLDHWSARKPGCRALVGDDLHERLSAAIGDVGVTANDEYFCHEAGHLVGLDVHHKYDGGYFRLAGRTLWPLVFVEEFRADLNAMGFAITLLPPEKAAAVFAYHLLHRFGLAVHCARRGGDGAGEVPYLLFRLLRRLGLAAPASGDGPPLRLAVTETEGLVETMRACAEHADADLTAYELSTTDPIEVALRAAAYYRAAMLDEDCLRAYEAMLQSAAERIAA